MSIFEFQRERFRDNINYNLTHTWMFGHLSAATRFALIRLRFPNFRLGFEMCFCLRVKFWHYFVWNYFGGKTSSIKMRKTESNSLVMLGFVKTSAGRDLEPSRKIFFHIFSWFEFVLTSKLVAGWTKDQFCFQIFQKVASIWSCSNTTKVRACVHSRVPPTFSTSACERHNDASRHRFENKQTIPPVK